MDAQKLAKVLAMAASDNESEAVHALRTARRLLDGHGVDFVEVARRVADAQPAAAGSARAQVEDLEDAVFDLRNEIRHLRAENERLRQGRPAPAAATPEPPTFADAAREAATAIRLRAELAEWRDRIEVLESQLLEARAHEAQTREHLKHEMAEAGRLAADNQRLALEVSDARARIAELSARLAATETRMATEAKPRKPSARTKARASASQFALL